MFYGGINLKFSGLCGALYICLVMFLDPRICVEKLVKTTQIRQLSNPARIQIWTPPINININAACQRVHIMAKYTVWKRANTL
jgi:hypothetical protein